MSLQHNTVTVHCTVYTLYTHCVHTSEWVDTCSLPCSVLGWDKLLEYASNEWAGDIKAYQLPHILKGLGPMHHVTQLGTSTILYM